MAHPSKPRKQYRYMVCGNISADVLDKMGLDGWKLIAVTNKRGSTGAVEPTYYFRIRRTDGGKFV